MADLDTLDIGREQLGLHEIKTDIEAAKTLGELFLVTNRLAEDFKIDQFRAIANHKEVRRENYEDISTDLAPDDFNTFALNILNRVEKVADALDMGDTSIIDTAALGRIKEQLNHTTVYVCIIGKYNSGKTTFINALLGKDILPVSMSPETAATLYIKHDHKEVVRLINKNTQQQVASAENITRYLSELHRGIRDGALMGGGRDEYLLMINIPLLQVKPQHDNGNIHLTPFLVDTPGSDEVGQTQLQTIAHLNLKSAAAYVYVMKYDDCQSVSSYEPFRLIYNRDHEIFKSERMTIVITHFDRYYEESGGQDYDGIRKTIATRIKDYLKCDPISPSIIYPVCGKWACMVKHFEATNYIEHKNDMCRSVYSVLSKRSGAPDMMAVCSMPAGELREHITKVCGIDETRKRLACVSERLSQIWHSNIVTGCDTGLKQAIDLTQQLENKATEEIRDIYNQTKFAKDVIRHHSVLLENIKPDTPFLEKLKEEYEKDTLLQSKVNDILDNAKQELLDRVAQDRKYSSSKLRADVERWHSAITESLHSLLKQKQFFHCQKLLVKQVGRIAEKFGRLRAAAALVAVRGGVADTLEDYYRSDDDGVEDYVAQTLQDAALHQPHPITVADIVTESFWQQIKLRLPFISANIVNAGHIEQIIGQWKIQVGEIHNRFFDTIKNLILLIYCQNVCKQLAIFKNDIGGQQEQLDDLCDRIRRLDEVHSRKQYCSHLLQQLEKLKKKLGRFKHQYF